MLTLLLAATIYAMPDALLTPGMARDIPLTEICNTRWGTDRRFVSNRMKRHVCRAYRVNNCPGREWEIDHLIPRSMGGADDILNLWPQPITEARKKDVAEVRLSRDICAGKIKLKEAQRGMAKDWRKFLEEQ